MRESNGTEIGRLTGVNEEKQPGSEELSGCCVHINAKYAKRLYVLTKSQSFRSIPR